MIISAATLNQTPLDWQGNRLRIIEVIKEAKNAGSSLLILPELALSGYCCQNHFRRLDVARAARDSLELIVPETRGITVNVGLPLAVGNQRFNATAWISDGAIRLIQCKSRLMKRYFDEEHWFDTPPLIFDWNVRDDTMLDIPLSGGNTGCRIQVYHGESDVDFLQENPKPADITVFSCASPFALGKSEQLREKIRCYSERNHCLCIYSNLLGCEGTPFIYDGTAMIMDDGQYLAGTPRFSYSPWNIIHTQWKSETQTPAALTPPDNAYAEFARAVPLALFDYMRKSRSNGFVLSLSGGADSAAVAVLVAQMVHLAWSELGRDEFVRKLDFLPGLADCREPKDAVAKLLTCVYQRTKNNGDTTANAARNLAESIGAKFAEIEIDDLVEQYKRLITPIYGTTPNWEKNDFAMQNIQARVRGPSVWFLANLQGSLLLSTGNRSEATVGYATMDGDTCGALAPLGGIDKPFLRDWLRWAEKDGPVLGDQSGSHFAVSALHAINEQNPTAELRPAERAQTDEKDLMPYPILNRLEQLIIRDELSPDEAVDALGTEFPDEKRNDLELWADRFISLWKKNQWKRRRYALFFHVDDTLEPDDWTRFPGICR